MRYSGISTACGGFSKAIEARAPIALALEFRFGKERRYDAFRMYCARTAGEGRLPQTVYVHRVGSAAVFNGCAAFARLRAHLYGQYSALDHRALAPLGESIAAGFAEGDAAVLYENFRLSEPVLLVLQMVVYVLTLGIPYLCCKKAVVRKAVSRGGSAMPRKPFAVMLLALGMGYIASFIGTLLFSWWLGADYRRFGPNRRPALRFISSA